jgi:hypothetical protein
MDLTLTDRWSDLSLLDAHSAFSQPARFERARRHRVGSRQRSMPDDGSRGRGDSHCDLGGRINSAATRYASSWLAFHGCLSRPA